MSKLFSPLSLVDKSVTVVSIESTGSYIDESFFNETLDFLSEQNRMLSVMNANLYKRISEADGNIYSINEGFSDFFGAVKNFIKSVIKFIKNLLAKFWVRINSLFMRDKYIEQHKSELAKFASQHEFDIQGFKYTFDEDVPSVGILQSFDQSIADFQSQSGGGKSKKDLEQAYNSFIDNKNSNSYLNDKRKECIKAKSNIDESDFKDELFKVFRNGDNSKSKITVTNAVVIEALTFFSGYDKMKTSTQRHLDNVEKLYNEIQKKLDTLTKKIDTETKEISIDTFVDNVDPTADKLALYELFTKAKSQEIQAIANIHTMAFSAKLDALKECYAQDKTILYGAFKKLLAKAESTMLECVDISEIPDYVSEVE